MISSNHLYLEPLLLQRITLQVPRLVAAGGFAEMEEHLRSGTPVPAAFVLYAGDVSGSSPGTAFGTRKLTQQWQVVLVTHPELYGQITDQTPCGELLSDLLRALQGWQPERTTAPFRRVESGEESVIYGSGVRYTVLTFLIDVFISQV